MRKVACALAYKGAGAFSEAPHEERPASSGGVVREELARQDPDHSKHFMMRARSTIGVAVAPTSLRDGPTCVLRSPSSKGAR
eukprot:12847787-Alexandrium_andersonii.AAC.1